MVHLPALATMTCLIALTPTIAAPLEPRLAEQQAPQFKDLQPNDWQKSILVQLEKNSFTVTNSRREKSIWFSIYLDVKKYGQPVGYPISVILDPGMGSGADEVPPSVQAVTVVDLSNLDEARAVALSETLKKKYADLSINVNKFPNGKPNINLRRDFGGKEVKDSLKIIRGLNMIIEAAKIASDTAGKPIESTAKATEFTDPVGKTMKAAGLVFTDIGGFYKMAYNFTDSKRKHFGYLRQRVDVYNGLSVQEAYAVFYESKTAPDAEALKNLFQKSFAIGGLVLEEPTEKQTFWRIRFRVEIPTTVTVQRFKEYMSMVVGTADELEKELGSEDKQ